jgi:hypothetical protein
MKRKKKSMVQQIPQQEIQPAQPENTVPQHQPEQSQLQYSNLYQQPTTYPYTQIDPMNQVVQTQNYDFKSENQRKLPCNFNKSD